MKAVNQVNNNGPLQVKLQGSTIIHKLFEVTYETDGQSQRLRFTKKTYQERFLTSSPNKMRSIKVSDIAIFYAEGRLLFIRTKDNQKSIIEHTIESLESVLDPVLFFRVNRGMIIAFDDIKDMVPYYGRRIRVALHTPVDKEILVSREKVAEFKKWLGE